MTASPSLDLALAPLMNELTRLQARIQQLERNQRAAQLGFSSVENGNITFNDANGSPQLVSGLQADGTFAHVSVNTQAPPVAPDQPLAGPGVLSLWVYWDGLMANGAGPLLDFDHIEVHCSAVAGFTPGPTTLQGIMTKSGLFGVGNLLAGTTYYVCFVAVNVAGNASAPSAQASGVPSSVPDGISPGQITALMLQTGSITAAQIAAQAGILGSQIANNTITAGNIVAGTITTALLAAGIVYAGIVNGTTIIGAQIIANGTGGQFLAYSGPATTGNLIASVSGANGTDSSRNPYDAGINAYTVFRGATYAIGLNQIGGPLGLPGFSVQTVLAPPASPAGVYGDSSSTTAAATLWSGVATPADVAAYVSVLSQVHSAQTNGQIQVAAGSVFMNGQSSVPPAGPAGAQVFADTAGKLKYVSAATPGGDGNTYTLGKLNVRVNSTITINSTADIIIAAIPSVATGIPYRFRALIVYLENQSAGTPTIGWDGSATSSVVIGRSWYDNGGGGQGAATCQVMNGAFTPNTGPTMVSGTRAYEAEGLVTFSAAGSFSIRGHCSVAADTWQVAVGSFLELEPAG